MSVVLYAYAYRSFMRLASGWPSAYVYHCAWLDCQAYSALDLKVCQNQAVGLKFG